MIELIIVVVAVILTSAMCSLFEAVLYSVPISHIETLARENKTSGLILRHLRQTVDRPISAILSLNTISNTGGVSLAGFLFATAVMGEQNTGESFAGDDRGQSKLSDLMRSVHFVAESHSLERILQMFLDRRRRRQTLDD